MEPKTLEALKASIEKWKRNARVRKPDRAAILGNSCPLCKIYADDAERYSDICKGCPVALKTGRVQCHDTPWRDARYALSEWRFGSGSGEQFRKAALVEVAFLESLLPEGERT